VSMPPTSTSEKDELKDFDAHLQGANAQTARRGRARRQNANTRDMLRSHKILPLLKPGFLRIAAVRSDAPWFTTGRETRPGDLAYKLRLESKRASRLVRRCSRGTIHRDGGRCEAARGHVAFVLGKPIDGSEGREGRPDLQGQHAKGLPGNLGKPLQREKRNQWDLCGHEDLKEMGGGPFVGFMNDTVARGVQEDQGERAEGHGDRKEGHGLSNQGEVQGDLRDHPIDRKYFIL